MLECLLSLLSLNVSNANATYKNGRSIIHENLDNPKHCGCANKDSKLTNACIFCSEVITSLAKRIMPILSLTLRGTKWFLINYNAQLNCSCSVCFFSVII